MIKKFTYGIAILFLGLAGCQGNNPFEKKEVTAYNEGVQLVNADKDMQAADYFKKVIAADPKHPLAHYNLGVIYDDNGMFDEAIVEFKKAIEINPKNVDAHYRLAIAYATQGDDEIAIEELKKVLLVEPTHIPTLYNLAVLHEGLGEQDTAMGYYRKVVELKPDHAEALNNLGLACAKKGMWDAAEEQLQKAINANPRYFEALNNLGVVLVQKQRYERAASVFQRALRQNPKSSQTLYNLAKISFENTHDYKAAAEYAQKYLALPGRHPNAPEISALLASAQKELGALQQEAESSVEGRVKRDALEFLQAVQRGDFREFYPFQPEELRDKITKEEWDQDVSQMDATKLADQKGSLLRLLGFDDLLGVQVKSIQLVSPQKAKVVLANAYGKPGEILERESYWQEVNGKWGPTAFMERIKDNWNRARVDSVVQQ